MSRATTKGELIAHGFKAINLLREAVAWVDEKRMRPQDHNFSPEWYERAKTFLASDARVKP